MSSIRIIAPVTSDNCLQYEDLYSQVASLCSTNRMQLLQIDMSAVSFVSVDGLLALVCIARLWHRCSGDIVVLQHVDPKVHRYLERMDLFTHCNAWLEQDRILTDHERFDRKPNSERLLEITPIPSDESLNATAVQAALQRIRTILDSSTSRDANAVRQLYTMLSEVAQNVVHSLDQGFAIVQRYRQPLGSSLVQNYRVMISVADLGIGIEESLRRNPRSLKQDPKTPLLSGSDYIIKALDVGVTSRNSSGGIGLYQVRKLVQEWQGILTIRSQRSRVQITGDRITRTDGLAEIPGTQVTIEVLGA